MALFYVQGAVMKVGDLVRHVVHSGALGIIVEMSEHGSAKVHWLTNSWGVDWTRVQNFEVIEKNYTIYPKLK